MLLDSKGIYKSRFTCAGVKGKCSAAEEEELTCFFLPHPTPTLESLNLLEVYALMNDYFTRSLDIVAAFLIGKDRGAAEGKPVYMRAPGEWQEIFQEWLQTVNPSD